MPGKNFASGSGKNMWKDLAALALEVGSALVGPVIKAMRAGDAEAAANAARVVAETVAMKRSLRAARIAMSKARK
jgi:hypothetical protein